MNGRYFANQMDYPEQGYPEGRFAGPVDEDLLCAICLNVLREPLQCVKNEHHFCAPCIKRHLRNTPKCPSCMQDLCEETLRKPTRYLTKQLGSLKVKCDNERRGCRELVELEQLQHHVDDVCGYTTVPCQSCTQVVNRRDMTHHRAQTCPCRPTPSCHGCASIKKELVELKESVEKKLQSANKNELESLKGDVGELKVAFRSLGEIVRRELHDVKGSLEKFKENHKVGQATAMLKTAPVEEPMEDAIVVIGGLSCGGIRLTSAEMYVWSKQMWLPFPSTNQPRSGSSAVVHQNTILVTGGRINDGNRTDSIEAIHVVDGRLGQWYNKPFKLPFPAVAHRCVVHKNHLFVIGGYGHAYDNNASDVIYSAPIGSQSPVIWNISCHMPAPRSCHGAELFDDNIVIIGDDPSVLSYDIKAGTLTEISELRDGIIDMATVRWGDHVVLLGGMNDSGEALNTAKMYNINTGKIYQLPPMKQKKFLCTAVALNNSIVVMGGYNIEMSFLDTVECFNFSTYTWSELPPMIESRDSFTSLVVPIKSSEIL